MIFAKKIPRLFMILMPILLVTISRLITPLHATTPPTLLFLGDSLTAGYMLNSQEAFPQQLQHLMGTPNITIINQGISGDTSFTLRHRLPNMTPSHPDAVFICIGANDGLRGTPTSSIRANLDAIIGHYKTKNIPVMLAGISLPQNYSPSYIQAFEAIFRDVSATMELPFLPFLLKDVAGIPTLNLSDGIHPNREGHRIIATTIHTFLLDENIISTQNQWQLPH